jgi:hypothetical protein
MTRLIFAFALALLTVATLSACDKLSRTTMSHKSSQDGVDTIHVQTEVVRDVATFRCIASRSGTCRIVVYTRRCEVDVSLREARMDEQCVTTALGGYELRTGERRAVTGLPKGFKECVSPDAMPVAAECVM